MHFRFSLPLVALLAISVCCTTMGQSWSLTGDGGTNPAANFIGTTDFVDFKIKADNTMRVMVRRNGNVGIGTGARVVMQPGLGKPSAGNKSL